MAYKSGNKSKMSGQREGLFDKGLNNWALWLEFNVRELHDGNTSQSHPYIHIQVYTSIQNKQECKWKICYKGTTIILVLKNILPCKSWVLFRKTSIVPLNKIMEFYI